MPGRENLSLKEGDHSISLWYIVIEKVGDKISGKKRDEKN